MRLTHDRIAANDGRTAPGGSLMRRADVGIGAMDADTGTEAGPS